MTTPPPVPPPVPLEYRPPTVRPPFVFPVPVLLGGLIVYAAIAVVAFLVEPRIEQILKDFKVDLSTYTVLNLRFSRWFANEFGWLFSLPIPVAIAVLFGALRRVRPATSTARPIWIGCLLALLIGAVMVISLLLPTITLIQSVSGPSRR